jgi:nitroreductase/dihydropteridine reductase
MRIFSISLRDKYTDRRIDNFFNYLQQQKKRPNLKVESQSISAKKIFREVSEEANFHHAAKQAYIALGIATYAAALEEVDASTMEGASMLRRLMNY